MKSYKISVCDDMGEPVYSRTVTARNMKDAEDMAWKWSSKVEADEGWFTTWLAGEA